MNEIEILQEAALADFIKDPPIVADIKAAYIAGWQSGWATAIETAITLERGEETS